MLDFLKHDKIFRVFAEKHTRFFGDTPSVKRGGNPFLKEFFEFERFFGAMKRGNNGRREWQNEGTVGMILPQPCPKTW